jgi:hypothetical protein
MNTKAAGFALIVALTGLALDSAPAGASGGQSFTFVVSNSILHTTSIADGGAPFPLAMQTALCAPKVEPSPKKVKSVKGGIEYGVHLSASQVASIRKKGCKGNIESNYKHAAALTGEAAPKTAYIAAYNTLNPAVNAGITNQNSGVPATVTAGINAEIAAYVAFDTSIAAINFTGQTRSDARRLLSDDVALDNALGTLSVNTNDASSYNQIFPTVTAAVDTVEADQTALNNDLGVKLSG